MQKFSPLSILLILFFPLFFHRCQKRFHGLCVCVNLPHPFWVLIYPFRFNLPVSGFPRPLIRLWGVDTNTKHAHFRLRDTHARLFLAAIHTHTYIYIYMYTHSLKCCRNTVPFLRHALLRQSSSALGGPLSHSGSPQLHQSPRQDREQENRGKKWDMLYLWGNRERCWWWKHSSLNFFHFKSICQVKAALSHIRFWQTQVAAGDRCLNFLKFKNFTAHKFSNKILVICALIEPK